MRVITISKVACFQASAAEQSLIDQAARLARKSRADFMLEASCEKACKVLADQTQFRLDENIAECFDGLVAAPLPGEDALRRLLGTPAPWEY